MTIEEMKKRKLETGFTNEMIAELSGVPLGTVQKIFSGQTKSPRYDTLQALQKVLADDVLVLCEPSAAYNIVTSKPDESGDVSLTHFLFFCNLLLSSTLCISVNRKRDEDPAENER